MSNLYDHAVKEMELAGWFNDPEDEMQKEMNDHILHMVREFSREGHSGFSTSYVLGVLQKLLNFEPLMPLTGEDWEWSEPIDDQGTRQNKRMSCIFKNIDGQEWGGGSYMGGSSLMLGSVVR